MTGIREDIMETCGQVTAATRFHPMSGRVKLLFCLGYLWTVTIPYHAVRCTEERQFEGFCGIPACLDNRGRMFVITPLKHLLPEDMVTCNNA